MLDKKPEMLKDLEVGIATAAAGIFGWVAFALTKVARRQMTWRIMAANLLLAASVGFITGTLLNYAVPTLPTSVMTAICTPIGAACDYWMLRYMGFLSRAADRVEGKVLDSIAAEPQAENPDEPESDDNHEPKNEG